MTPVELFTVATDVLLDDHAPPELPFEVNVVVPLTQIACVPLTVPALGAAATVKTPLTLEVPFQKPPPPVLFPPYTHAQPLRENRKV
jgi:hypothetical protein